MNTIPSSKMADMTVREAYAANAPRPPWWVLSTNFEPDAAGSAAYAAQVADWAFIYADAMVARSQR